MVRDESTLISCGAEGTVKVWDVSGPSGGGSLRLTWGWFGVEGEDEMHEELDTPGATAVEALKSDLKRVAVAYQNAVVKIFDIESGKELSRLDSDISYGWYSSFFFFEDPPIMFVYSDGTSATQINRIVSHPTMSILVTAHEDKYIRIFDITTGLLFSSEQPTFTDLLIRPMYALHVSPPGWRHILVYRRCWFLACVW